MSKYEKAINDLAVVVGRIDQRTKDMKDRLYDENGDIPKIEQHLGEINGLVAEHSRNIIQLTERSGDHTEDIRELKERTGNMAILNIIKKKWFWVVVIIIILIVLGGTGVIDVQTLLLQLLG